jgi:hypothetical protein
MDLLIDQSTWVPVISIVSRAIDPIAELHATAITCQPSRHRKIPGSHSNSKKITHSIGRRPRIRLDMTHALEASRMAPKEPTPVRSQMPQRPRILVIDDDPDVGTTGIEIGRAPL